MKLLGRHFQLLGGVLESGLQRIVLALALLKRTAHFLVEAFQLFYLAGKLDFQQILFFLKEQDLKLLFLHCRIVCCLFTEDGLIQFVLFLLHLEKDLVLHLDCLFFGLNLRLEFVSQRADSLFFVLVALLQFFLGDFQFLVEQLEGCFQRFVLLQLVVELLLEGLLL